MESLEPRRMLALTAELLHDTNTLHADAYPNNFTKIGDTAYFFANDAIHGYELWKTDGTSGGTSLVKDILPGVGSSNSLFSDTDNPHPAAVNGKLIFNANDGIHGHELWVSDGTEAGTTLLKDFNPGAGDTWTGYSTVMNGFAYFLAHANGATSQLWRTDGTTAGTSMVADIAASTVSNLDTAYTVVGSNLYFKVFGANHTYLLYKTDGTSSGTTLVKTLNNDIYTSASWGDLLAFSNVGQLWTSDGTPTGTAPFLASPLYVNRMITSGSTLFTSTGAAVYRISPDHTATLLASTQNVLIDNLAFLDASTLLLTTTEGTVRSMTGRLFSMDVNSNVLTQLCNFGTADITPSVNVASISTELHKAFFNIANTTTGRELWVSDGTAAGSGIVKDLYPGIESGFRFDIVNLNGQIIFGGNDGTNGNQLWTTNGTAVNTSLLKQINVVGTGNADLLRFADAGTKLYFINNDGTHGFELWVSNGTDAGTSMVSDLIPGAGNGLMSILGAVNGVALFSCNLAAGAGIELCVSDGTAAGTHLLYDITPGPRSTAISQSITVGNQVYFVANAGLGPQIWVSDGTSAGTHAVTAFPGDFDTFTMMGSVNGQLVFAETPGGESLPLPWTPQLYSTDGITLLQLSSGNFKAQINTSNPTAEGNTLYFDAVPTGTSITAVYKTDGTLGGTRQVTALAANIPTSLTVLNGIVYYINGTTPGQLWRSDGTSNGTNIVRTFARLSNLTALNGQLLFEASVSSSEGNTKLWVSDGTSAGSHQLLDIDPGSFNSPGSIKVVGDRGFFIGDDGVHGKEPWVTDGTTAGTYIVDVHPGSEWSGSFRFTGWGSSVVFSGDDGIHGTEPMFFRIPPKVLGSSFDTSTLAHAIRVQFNANVASSLAISALTLKRITGDSGTETTIDRALMSIAYDALTNTATITFPGMPNGSLATGNYNLTLAGSAVFDILGTQLDGVGSGSAGTDYVFSFFEGAAGRLPTTLSGNTVYLKKDADHINLDEWIDSATPGVGTPTQKKLLSTINGVNFIGRLGDDTLTLDYSGGPLGIAVAVNGSNGGANTIRIVGTTGDDVLTASAGGIAFSSSLAGFTPTIVSMAHLQVIRMAGGSGGNDLINLTGGSYTLDADTPSGTPNVGVTVGRTASAKFDSDQHLANLTLNGGSAGLSTVRHSMYLNGLSIANNSLLDIANSFLYLNNTTTTFAAVKTYLDAAYNLHGMGNPNAPYAGDYKGLSGITSSIAKASYANDMVVGLGYYDGALQDANNPDSAGQIVGPDSNSGHGTGIPLNQILIRPTLTGDFNGDGVVNSYDVSLFNSYGLFNSGPTPLGWQAGDLNGDGVVNVKDVTVFNSVGSFNTGAFPTPAAIAGTVAAPSFVKPSVQKNNTPAVVVSPPKAHRVLKHSICKATHSIAKRHGGQGKSPFAR